MKIKSLGWLTLIQVFPACAIDIHPSSPTMIGPPHNIYKDIQGRTELSMKDAVFLALRHNPAVRSHYLERIVEKFDLRLAADTFRPQWYLQASLLQKKHQQGSTRENSLSPKMTGLTPYGTQLHMSWTKQIVQHSRGENRRSDGINFSLIQPLLRSSGREINTLVLQQSHIQEQVNQLQLKLTVMQTITETINGYHQLLRAQEALVIAEASVQRGQEQMTINQHLIDAGRMAEMEKKQSESQLANQLMQLEEARNRHYESEQYLQRLIGISAESDIFASDQLQAQYSAMSASQAFDLAETQEPAYLATLLTGRQMSLDVKGAKDAERWDLSLQIGSQQQRGSERKWEHYASLQLEIPLDNLAARHKRLSAEVALKKQHISINDAKAMLKQRINIAVRELSTRWRQHELALQAVVLSKLNVELEVEKLQAGRSTNFQVISFENSLREAEQARLDALLGYLQAQSELDLAMGMTLESWEVGLNDATQQH